MCRWTLDLFCCRWSSSDPCRLSGQETSLHFSLAWDSKKDNRLHKTMSIDCFRVWPTTKVEIYSRNMIYLASSDTVRDQPLIVETYGNRWMKYLTLKKKLICVFPVTKSIYDINNIFNGCAPEQRHRQYISLML